jgi:hypothetical protein
MAACAVHAASTALTEGEPMNVLAWLLVLLIGAALPLQALVNARLAQLTFGPVFA